MCEIHVVIHYKHTSETDFIFLSAVRCRGTYFFLCFIFFSNDNTLHDNIEKAIRQSRVCVPLSVYKLFSLFM